MGQLLLMAALASGGHSLGQCCKGAHALHGPAPFLDFAHGPTFFGIATGVPALSVAFSDDGELLAAGCADSRIRVWHVFSKQLIATQEAHQGRVTCVAFVGPRLLISGGDDGTVRAWQVVRQGELDGMWEVNQGAPVTCLAYHRNDNTIASGAGDGSVKFWDDIGRPKYAPLKNGDLKSVSSIAFHPKEVKLLIGGAAPPAVTYWDVPGNVMKWAPKEPSHALEVKGVAIDPSGRIGASAGKDGKVAFWQLDDGKRQPRVWARDGGTYWSIHAVAFQPHNGDVVATVGMTGATRMWSRVNGHQIWQNTQAVRRMPLSSVAFSNSGILVATGRYDGVIEVRDAGTGSMFAQFFCDFNAK